MKMHASVVVAICVALVFQTLVQGAEYFVSKQGSDANNGGSRQAAFLTIQNGVDALKPGDTLTIGPGEYVENVERTDLGAMDVDTLIRAEIPGTAVLRGDVPAPEFKKVEGYRFVYAAPFDQEPKAILEHHKMHTLLPMANISELEFAPGFFHYDEASKTIYLSNPDLSAPDQRRYTVAVSGTSGLNLIRPKRVIIDGLAATGFYPGWGILLGQPESCTVRNCVGFMNVGGIVLEPVEGLGKGDGGSNNVVEHCVAYGNTFGGIVRYGANNDVVRNCTLYKNVREGHEHFGVMHYATMTGPLLFKDNISWGHSFNYSVKPANQQERLENCVGLGYIRIAPGKMSHNLIGGGNEYDRSSTNAPADTVLFAREKELDKDVEFADPLNMDYRLQPDSRFSGTAPDESDRGPYPYEKNIFYLSLTGDDQADGLSMRSSWRTLAHAFKGLRPGDTLYLAEGEYSAAPLNKVGDGTSPIKICARGRETVIIRHGLSLTGGAGIVFQRLNFSGGATLKESRDLRFNNCTFFGTEDGLNADRVENLTVTHSVFARVPLELKNSSGVHLSGNIYAPVGTPSVRLDAVGTLRYSDYNSYRDPSQCWEVNGALWSFTDLQQAHDGYSRTLVPKFAVEKGVPRLVNDHPFQSVGPGSTDLGIHHEYELAAKTMDLVGPFLHSTSDTTANIEWWSSLPGRYSLAWGETPETKNTVGGFTGVGRFNTFSLTDLKPGQKYYFKIVSAGPSDWRSTVATVAPEDATLSFQTAALPAEPRVYYVAPDGHDATNDGLSREQAFKTINHAAAQVGPGDRVMIAGGDYPETVRIRAAGTPERPITFRSITGEKPALQLANLPRAFEVVAKPDIRFDGLYFRGQDMWREGFVVRQSPRVQITRCLDVMIAVDSSPETLIRNCVIGGGWNAVSISGSPGSIVENNVFASTILRQISASGALTVRRNIFCECIRNKMHQTLLELSGGVTETDNCFYLFWPEDEKLAVSNLPLPIYRAQTGSNAFGANPMMPGAPGWLQGWSRVSRKDFDTCFSTNPELILSSIGLQPEAFGDFTFETADWPYTQAWAEKFVEARDAAEALAKAGKDAEAFAAYTELLEHLPMSDRLKSDVLEKASLCAQGLKDYGKAMELAKEIPVEPLAMHRQMQLMLEQKHYDALLAAFNQKALGGRDLHRSYIYPEHEDVAADLFYYRSLAYVQMGDLAAAEADLKAMNDKRQQLSCTSGESIHDLTWLRLGDFYRTQLKDDAKALEAYLSVCDRNTWAYYGTITKPVLTGGSDTLVAATHAASEILRKQGKLDQVKELQTRLAEAQAQAKAALVRKQ
jgi:parallel beta-helix repeat protein